jgi:tetratricopeptide (TPR) repeat protein
MWFQLFIEVLLRMHHKSSDRKELIDICKKFYTRNVKQMEIIDEFEKNYKAEKAIWWYTRDSCFYRMMNKALRVQDFDMLFAFRFFITDIAKQLKREYENFIRTNGNRNLIQVYRGQLIGIDELELMQNNIGEFLSMNSFLSTSRNRSTALEFTRVSRMRDNMRPIIFEIEINPRLRTKAFADIGETSYFQDEDEVLIMLGALFRIEKIIEDEKNKIWVARVSLASEDDYHLKEIFTHMKEKIGDDTNLDSLGKLLLRMDENEKARKCYKRMLEETQLAVGDAHLGFGWASLRCNDCEESLEHFEESLQIRKRILGENHASVGESYSFLGETHRKKRDYERALVDLNKAMEIQEIVLPANSLDLAATYDTIASTYTLTEKYDLALKYFNKTLKIRQATLPSNHPQVASIYSNLGWLYECEGSYTKALDYYQKALEIFCKTLPPTHTYVIGTEKSMRKLKDKMKYQSSF